jgi:hypothetical protein
MVGLGNLDHLDRRLNECQQAISVILFGSLLPGMVYEPAYFVYFQPWLAMVKLTRLQ